MSLKSVLWGAGIVLLAAITGAGALLLFWREPDWYHRCAVPQGRDRKEKSGEFISEFGDFVDKLHYDGRDWESTFNEKCINSYFDESFGPSGVAERVLPEGVTQPRIAVDPDRIRLAFRYGAGLTSTIISIDLRVWLAPKERNVVALELQALHAGSLPISAQALQDRVTEAARPQNIDVTWYRHNGNPVALLRFQADRAHPTIQLQQLELHQGWIKIKGRSTEAPTLGAMLPFMKPQAN